MTDLLDDMLAQVDRMADRLDALCAARYDAEFNEADHPRGQPENAGQFGPGGGSHMKSAEGTGGGDLPENNKASKPPRVYSKEYIEHQAVKKFSRVKDLDQQFTEVESQNEAARRDPKRREVADCAALIMKMGVRPGSEKDTGAKVKAYGATTLEGRHVVETAEGVRLRFVGKKGVNINLLVDDKEIAAMLLKRKKSAGSDGPLFSISEKALLSHVHSLDHGNFMTKDFRTLLGTKTALREVEKSPKPKDEKDYKKRVMAVAKTVAARLGNTATVALQSYIAPEVFLVWRVT